MEQQATSTCQNDKNNAQYMQQSHFGNFNQSAYVECFAVWGAL